MATVNVATNRYGVAKFIIAPTIAEGANYTSLTTALSEASSGDTIFFRPGTYSIGSVTLKAGINLVAWDCDAITPNVTLVGKLTATFAGTCTISGIRLQTNSDFFLVVSGSSATIINLYNCFLNCSNNTGISHTTSSSSSIIYCSYCQGDIGTTGITLFTSSSSGFIQIEYCRIDNSGGSSTASSVSGAIFNARFCLFTIPFSSSSSGYLDIRWCQINTSATNTICLTCNGTTNTHQIKHNHLRSGTTNCVSIGASATSVLAANSILSNAATNAIVGSGTLYYGNNVYISTSGKGAGLTKIALTTD